MSESDGARRRILTLIKHARPEKVEGVDSHAWVLSPQGRADAQRLAERLKSSPTTYHAILSSDEPKAAQTAQILADNLSLPLHFSEGLHEHDRSNVPLMRTPEFVSAIANFFRKPTQLVLGNETARQALKRFEKSVDHANEQYPEGNLLIVSHGTVLALWLEAYCQLDGYTVWRQMGLPSYVSMTWPGCDVVERLDSL
jgi:broad specificity phosphatase PhoE